MKHHQDKTLDAATLLAVLKSHCSRHDEICPVAKQE